MARQVFLAGYFEIRQMYGWRGCTGDAEWICAYMLCVCLFMCECRYLCACMYTQLFIYIRIYARGWWVQGMLWSVYIYLVCVCVCMCVRIYIYILCLCIYKYACMCICVCVCIYIHIHVSFSYIYIYVYMSPSVWGCLAVASQEENKTMGTHRRAKL
jgi:hypothetical protein